VGKTSTARILARALNCEHGPTEEPCGKCAFCLSIAEGSSVDVREIDGASNNSVDDIRELRENIKYAPAGGRYKVYIIDEAHMLSTSAFNALLKTLEEPPAHVIFILATTDPKKIPLTVFSRCQHLPFRRVPAAAIKARLKMIADSEGMKVSAGSLELIARAADGSVRDSLTILDQLASVSSEIEDGFVTELLGITDTESLRILTEAVLKGDRKRALEVVSGFADKGANLRQLLRDMVKVIRDALVLKYAGDIEADALDLDGSQLKAVREVSGAASEEHLLLFLAELLKAEPELKFSANPRIALEMALLRASYFSLLKPLSRAFEALERLEGAPEAREAREVAPPQIKEAPPVKEALPVKEEAPVKEAPPELDKEAPPSTLDAGALVEAIALKARPGVASGLRLAAASLEGGVLTLRFAGPEGALVEETLTENASRIEKEAAVIYGAPLKLRLEFNRAVGRPTEKDLRDRAQANPFVREALELFDGMIVEVREQAKKNNTDGNKGKAG
jgi:DNA polymerase-3 subunit gamma/tau